MTEFTMATRDLGSDGRTLEGIAVPWNEPITGATREFGSAVESFAPGSFDDVIAEVERGRRIAITDGHDGTVVGYADHLENRPEGLWFSGRALSNSAADSFLPAVVERVMQASIDFAVGQVRRGMGQVQHIKVKHLAAIAATPAAAYRSTFMAARDMEGPRVTDINETPAPEPEPTPPPAPEPVRMNQGDIAVVAQRVADEAIRNWAARNAFSGGQPADLFADFRGKTFGELAKRGMSGKREDREWIMWAARALADTVTTAGANAGMVTPGVVGDVHGIVSRGRPAITAFGGPRPIPDESGMSIDWPYFDGTLTSLVGAQSAQKAAITSAAVDIKKGTEALNTYAGGSDISFQLLRRSSPSYLDAYYRILLTAWGVVTDAAFVTELESGSVTGDYAEALSAVDATEFKNLVIDASIAVQTATGQPAEFVLASTTAFTQFAKLFTPITTLAGITNTGLGGTDIRGLTINVGNLPVIHVPSITADKVIVSNRQAAAWYEDGPFQVQDTDVEKLGQNTAIWSMGAGARFIPAGIIEVYDVTPA